MPSVPTSKAAVTMAIPRLEVWNNFFAILRARLRLL